MALNRQFEKPNIKQLIYCDRNNTPDIWSDIKKVLSYRPEIIKTILIVPEQGKHSISTYKTPNPLAPKFIYECIRRIFSRKSHECLSSDNKEKVIEVLIKFAKLYDGTDFSDQDKVGSMYDDVIHLDFTRIDQFTISKETE